jgi:hypothetical protein
MQLTQEVRWNAADLAAAAALLASLGGAIELAFRLSLQSRTQAISLDATLTAFILLWAMRQSEYSERTNTCLLDRLTPSRMVQDGVAAHPGRLQLQLVERRVHATLAAG